MAKWELLFQRKILALIHSSNKVLGERVFGKRKLLRVDCFLQAFSHSCSTSSRVAAYRLQERVVKAPLTKKAVARVFRHGEGRCRKSGGVLNRLRDLFLRDLAQVVP